MVKELVKTILRKFGYEVSLLRGFYPPYFAEICQAKTVIDVGVGYGTYPLYKAFPAANFVLVEPLKEYENSIEEISRKYNCKIFYKAVSDTEDRQEIIIDTKKLEMSSLTNRTAITATGNQLKKRLVEVTTLDRIFREIPNLEKPILLKIDTEGHELKALQGAKSLLQETDTVIAEVSVTKRFEEGYEFEDLILFMRENGFYLLTFLNIIHQRGEISPRFTDIVFKRR